MYYKWRGRQLEKLTDAEYCQPFKTHWSQLHSTAVQPRPCSNNPSSWKESFLLPKGYRSHHVMLIHIPRRVLPALAYSQRGERVCLSTKPVQGEREEPPLLAPQPGALFSSCCSSTNLGQGWPDLTLPGQWSIAQQTSTCSQLLFPCPWQEGRPS